MQQAKTISYFESKFNAGAKEKNYSGNVASSFPFCE